MAHAAIFLPKHCTNGARSAESLQTQDTLISALLDLNSDDPQVRATTRHLFDNLRARGFEGSRIGAGLGKLLRQAGKEGFNLRYLGPNQDALTMELPIAWLKDKGLTGKQVGALCNQGLRTVEQLRRWAANPPQENQVPEPAPPAGRGVEQWRQSQPDYQDTGKCCRKKNATGDVCNTKRSFPRTRERARMVVRKLQEAAKPRAWRYDHEEEQRTMRLESMESARNATR